MARTKFPRKTQYQFRQGSRLPQDKADVVGRELERLEQAGAVTAQRVVKAAKSRNNPMRSLFEWDDSKASEQYRLEQARHLIRSVEVVIEYEKSKAAPPMRAYVAFDAHEAPVDADNRYVATHVVMSNASARERWLRQAMRELTSWRNRYQQFAEFAAIFSEIDKVTTKLNGKHGPDTHGRRNMKRAGPK